LIALTWCLTENSLQLPVGSLQIKSKLITACYKPITAN
jgi:hypothetical protein